MFVVLLFLALGIQYSNFEMDLKGITFIPNLVKNGRMLLRFEVMGSHIAWEQ